MSAVAIDMDAIPRTSTGFRVTLASERSRSGRGGLATCWSRCHLRIHCGLFSSTGMSTRLVDIVTHHMASARVDAPILSKPQALIYSPYFRSFTLPGSSIRPSASALPMLIQRARLWTTDFCSSCQSLMPRAMMASRDHHETKAGPGESPTRRGYLEDFQTWTHSKFKPTAVGRYCQSA